MKKPDINTNTQEFLNHETAIFEVIKNNTLTIIDVFTEAIDVTRELVVEENATLNYIKIGRSKEISNITYINKIKDNATLNMFVFEKGSSFSSIQTQLKNDNGSFNINGLIDLQDTAKVEFDVKTNHQNKSFSDIKFRNLLADKASAKISMFSSVEESAGFSKAFQNSQTILLSDDSFVSVTPHLEILIDELEASHGATSGDLDKDSIYYLKSRGIKEEDAKVMLLNALRDEVYTSFENEELRKIVKGLV